MLRYLSVFFILMIFMGCSPKYKVISEYKPSTSSEFKVCLAECKLDKSLCQSRCTTQHKLCMSLAYNKAKKLYDKKDLHYKEEYKKYILALEEFKNRQKIFLYKEKQLNDDYNYFSKECKKKKDTYACRREDEIYKNLLELKTNAPKRPEEPKRVEFEEILKFFNSSCSNECSCDKDFDICYESCGGIIKRYKICIENCD